MYEEERKQLKVNEQYPVFHCRQLTKQPLIYVHIFKRFLLL